jgi:anti-sigma regulatory factor (Ser/Thr protein kinase)
VSAEAPSAIILRADLGELARLADWIRGLSERHELSAQVAFHLDFCLTELVTNVINYAYPGGAAPADAVAVRFLRAPTEVVLEIEDHGVAFDPLAHAPGPLPTSLEDAQVGGLGLLLVRKFAGELRYRREGERNFLRLAFPAPLS